MGRKLRGVCLLVVLLAISFASIVHAKEPITLKFACWDYEISGYDMALITEFERQNPQIKVEVYDIPASEYPDKMLIMLAGGEDIDVFYAKDPTMYGGLVLRKQIIPMDELMERDGIDLDAYGGNLEFITIDEQLYGIPYRADFWVLYYNKDVFDRFGVDYPTNDMTWPEYRQLAKKLTQGEGVEKTYGTHIHTWASCYFIYGLIKGEGDLVEGDYSMLKDGLELNYQIQMVDKSATDFATNTALGAHYRGLFEQGNIGMMYQGTWVMQQLLYDAEQGLHDINWGMVQLPQWEGYDKGTIGSVTPVVINTKTKYLEEAWELAKFLGGVEGATILADNVLVPAYLDETIFERFAQVEGFPSEDLPALITENIYMEWPPHPLAGMLGIMVEEEITLAMTGNKSIDQAIKDMESRREEIFRQNQ